MAHRNQICPVCGGRSAINDVVDFNKNCLGVDLPDSGIDVPYCLCVRCKFCFAPTIAQWSQAKFKEQIYNQEYILVDPDYVEIRPRANADFLLGLFDNSGSTIKHLDYGGGGGMLSQILQQNGWRSASYDPLIDSEIPFPGQDKYDLISAFEVFEHVPSPTMLMRDLTKLLAQEGIILFSTLLSDNNLPPNGKLVWWYAAPRNGHISLFSRRSLIVLAEKYQLNFGSLSEGLHILWRHSPPWAANILSAVS